jgi:hypothetical protein
MYKFKKEPDSNNEFDISEVVFTVDANTATELTTEMFYFLLACGFQKESILNSLSALIEEHNEEV